MARTSDLYTALVDCLDRYRDRFIKPHIPAAPGTDPKQYELDVKAYCLLCHAAFEQYFEDLVLHVLGAATEAWTMQNQASDALVMLLCHYGSKYEIPDKDQIGSETKSYDYIRTMTDAAKVRFSTDVHANHGMSPRYLRYLLTPLAIDFNPDANTLNSLCQLSKERGEYAHKGFTKRSLSPEDALKYAEDCAKYAGTIRDRVITKGWA